MRKRRILVALSVLVATPLLGAAGFALAGSMATTTKTYVLKATLRPSNETPPVKNAAGAAGVFSAKLTLSGSKGTLAWKLTFRNLTGPAFAAHVHLGSAGKAGKIAISLCGPCRTGAHGTTSLKASSAVAKAMLHRGAYANVHTKKHPNGEIRGQIRVTGTTTKPVTGTSSTTAPTYTYTYSRP